MHWPPKLPRPRNGHGYAREHKLPSPSPSPSNEQELECDGQTLTKYPFSSRLTCVPREESPTGEDVLSRQHGFRKAPVRVEVQCQLQIFAARAAGLGVRLTPELNAKYPYVPGSTSMFG